MFPVDIDRGGNGRVHLPCQYGNHQGGCGTNWSGINVECGGAQLSRNVAQI